MGRVSTSLCVALGLALVASAIAQSIYSDEFELVVESNKKYKLNEDDLQACNYTDTPCALLNDIWGYEFTDADKVDRYYAVVGMTNGIDIVDVTDPTNPTDVFFAPGCINNWRDMKQYDDHIYGISEYTITCSCPAGENCEERLEITAPASMTNLKIPMTEGRLTPQISQVGNVTGSVKAIENWASMACETLEEDMTGFIALVPQGLCSFAEKILNVQAAGAISVIIVSPNDADTYPGMTGLPTGINITGVLIGNRNGMLIKEALDGGETVEVALTNKKYYSNVYSPPEGLTVIDMSNPAEPTYHRDLRYFQHAHNLYIEEDRGVMYTCGMSDSGQNQTSFGDISNGGIFAYDLTSGNLSYPEFMWYWNTSYVHDLTVAKCEDSYILFAALIYDDEVVVLNVTDPTVPPVELNRWSGRQGLSHNVWPDKTCKVMYVTHEEAHEPITVWAFQENADGTIRWTQPPQYLGQLAINQFVGTLPHNVFVEGDVLWASYYVEGVAAWNISNPYLPEMIAHYDTSNLTSGFGGVWGVYPYAGTGYVYASDREEGLFVMALKPTPNDHPLVPASDGWKIAVGIIVPLVVIALVIFGVLYFRKRFQKGGGSKSSRKGGYGTLETEPIRGGEMTS